MAPEILELSDPSRPAWDGDGVRPVRTHVWRPERQDDATPLVVVSHGTGGAAAQMAWLCEALAEAGFIAAAVDHHGNNLVDGYLPEGFVRWWERALDLSYVIDRLRAYGPAGAAGFSIGGYTAAALAGVRIDEDVYGALLRGELEAPPTPEYPGLERELRARHTPDELADWAIEAARAYGDPRVRAAFLICPSVGPMIAEASLRAVDVPVAVRWAGADDITPAASNGMRYAALVPGADGRSVGEDVGHFAFLGSNGDTADVREKAAADAVGFFEKRWGARRWDGFGGEGDGRAA